MSKSLIIPSAGFAKRLYPLSAHKPKILIELNGIPIFHLLYKKAIQLKVDNIIIAINEEFKRQVEEFLNFNYQNAEIPIYIEIVDNPDAGVLYSVSKATQSKYALDDILLILSDTVYMDNLPINEEQNNSFVIYKTISGSQKRWCLIETDVFNNIKKIWDKPQSECPTHKALIGIYYFRKELFNQSCKKVFKSQIKIANEFQLSQAFEEYMKTKQIYAIPSKKNAWHDTGTLENLNKASVNFFVSRNFNHIKIENGYLIKESQNKQLLKNQYMWFITLKEKFLIPTIYDYEENSEVARIKMELCSLPDLGTLFNFCQSETKFFIQVIDYILTLLNKTLYKTNIQSSIENNIEMFVNKIKNRFALTSYQKPKFYDKLLCDLQLIANAPIYTRIHGDLILSNILFDPQRMTIKLIDPRGEYGNLGIYGDIRYDLAKLLHSLDGRYESIINNLYKIENDKVIFYSSQEKDNCFKEAIKVLETFVKSKGISMKDLYIIEASLFLSMLPLHEANPEQQKAFYLIACRILKDIYE